MSIHVTVSGNPVNIRRGRMVLSDLDQIKKNERDRRRRLRLEQVRQQSKEISNRLLERAKKIAREELSKLEKDGKSELRQMHDKKIMEMQEKYQEDLEDIGQAHASAALQPDANVIIEEEARRDRSMALKRGKEAAERIKEAKEKESAEPTYQERLRKVREEENTRAAMVAKIPKSMRIPKKNKTKVNSSEEDTNEEIADETLTPKRKNKKSTPKKSPRKTKKSILKERQKTPSPKPGPSGLQKQPHKVTCKKKVADAEHIEHVIDSATSDQVPRKTVPVISTTPTKADKVARYNPGDYTQDTSDTSSINSSSSSSVSDDSSYFSDAAEQITCNRTFRAVPSTCSKVRLYDHDTHQRNVYNMPLGIVERINIGNEPNAIEAAEAVKHAENVKTDTIMSRKLNAQRRGQDAILREKVRKDYQALLQNLKHLAQEERKLKASQIQSNAEEDTHMRLHQRNKCQEEHQKKLNRATKSVLCTNGTPKEYSHLAERVITLPTRKKCEMHSDVPNSTWHETHPLDENAGVCYTHQDKDGEESREEQILDMLKKVERQKRLLLQEFGGSLPDDIFNVSIKPLFESRTPVQESAQVTDDKALSPEVKVINMSSSNECVRKDRKVKKKPEKSPTKKIEIAVQAALDKTGPAEDKSVQVELLQENVENVPHLCKDTISQVPHPIEPQVTVITPETDDSSNDSSSSSEITGMIIEIDKKEVTVTPKKKKGTMKVSKRLSPRIYQKIRPTSVSSKATSPMKRFSRSHSSSRLTSPQKKTKCTDVTDTANRRINIHMSETGFNNETDPSQETRVSIDASAESSQTISGTNEQDQCLSRPYRIRTQTKKWIRIKDTSDTTSTSFASLPPAKPKSMIDTLSNITPILELLDSSGPEDLRRLRHDISPVSTPETPSPRTMKMPSNIPHADKISRVLKYTSVDSQTNDSIVLSSTQNDQSVSTNLTDARQEETTSESLPSQQPPATLKACTCKNPKCRLLHLKLDDIQDYALKNCPEILQKYEDLQNLCTERIASLTDLIERVRSEQKDIDLSLISPSDETSLMQLPTISKPTQCNDEPIRKLIEGIETIHTQIAKTLLESQKIIGNGGTRKEESSRDAEVQVVTSTPKSNSVDTITISSQNSEVAKGKAKPKLVSDERVNIELNRFKIQQKSQVTSAKTSERNSWPPCVFPLHEEEVIEELSKEILEQSKNLNKTNIAFARDASKVNDEILMQHKVSPPKKASPKTTTLEHVKDDSVEKGSTRATELTKENDFVPILTGISKVSRTHGSAMLTNTRSKPPVTLLNAPHWQELESSGHELSTIVEFDTTDTVNKSIKSPTKSKSIGVSATEDSPKILLKRATDVESFKSAIMVKPSMHVAPLPVQHQNLSHEITADSTNGTKHSADLISAHKLQKTTTTCSSPEKLKNTTDCIVETKTEAERDWVDCTLEKCNKKLQCDTTNEEQVKDLFGPSSSLNTDFNNHHKNSQHRTTSTSLNSFSGLSGISEITSSPSSDLLKYASSPEEMETALKKLGLGWAVTTLKKTREASALSSSSNSDITPINTARRMISPTKKHVDPSGLPDISDVSSISIKEASKSTEQAVLLKGRTSTPKFQNSNSNSERSSTTNTSESLQEPSDSLTVPNVSLTKTRSDNKQLQSP